MSNDLQVKHHSPSSISAFLENRSKWYLQKFKNVNFPFSGDTAARGTAVEAAINMWIEQKGAGDIKECITHAHEVFVRDTIGLTIEPDFRNSINGLVEKGISHVNANYFPLNEIQLQTPIAFEMEGFKLPITGYMDWYMPKTRKMIVDCKVKNKTPSELPQSHKIQGAVYRLATGIQKMEFMCLIPLKAGPKVAPLVLSNDDFEEGVWLIKKALTAIEYIYDHGVTLDGQLLDMLFMPNPGDLWASDAKIMLEAFDMCRE